MMEYQYKEKTERVVSPLMVLVVVDVVDHGADSQRPFHDFVFAIADLFPRIDVGWRTIRKSDMSLALKIAHLRRVSVAELGPWDGVGCHGCTLQGIFLLQDLFYD